MNWKITTLIFIIGIMTFSLGWYLHEMKLFGDGVIADGKRVDSIRKANPDWGTIKQHQLDSLMILSNTIDKSKNFALKISGRFVLKGAHFAGFNFYSPSRITWINEMDPGHPDSLKIRWLNNTTFITRDQNQINEKSPPRVWIYQVISFDGKKLILKDIWTGWNDFKDEKVAFIKNDKADE